MAVNKVEYGDTVLLDLTNDTVSGDTLLKGVTAHNASGEVVEGVVDLGNYYTKEETDALIPDTSGLATEQFVIQQVSGIDMSPYAYKDQIPSLDGYATEYFVNNSIQQNKPDLSDYAKKSEIPSVAGLATETYVTASINAAKPDLSSYAKKSEIPSIAGLASETYVNQKIAAIPAPDLSSYAKKTDIPSLNGYATTSYVDAEIAEVTAVATGKTASYVFDTVAALDTWLGNSTNKAKLKIGDVFLIKAVNVPDYWWDGSAKQILETTKVDLSSYALTANIPSIKVNNAVAADTATTASNSLTVGGYTIVISSTAPTNANNKTITFVTG